jgi:hypothetical protein
MSMLPQYLSAQRKATYFAVLSAPIRSKNARSGTPDHLPI